MVSRLLQIVLPLPKLNAALGKSCAKAGFSAAFLKKLRKSCVFFQTCVEAVEMLRFFSDLHISCVKAVLFCVGCAEAAYLSWFVSESCVFNS